MLRPPARLVLVVAAVALATSAAAKDPAEPNLFDKLLDAGAALTGPKRGFTRQESAQLWDGFLTNVAKRAAGDTPDRALRADFFTALIEGRFDVVSVLAAAGGAKA